MKSPDKFQNYKVIKIFYLLHITVKSAFTCNRDEISSRDETRPGMKKFLFTREFHPGMKRVEFHSGMKPN